MDRREFLDLWERLVTARAHLDGKCDRAAYLHNMTEFVGLDGQRKGIELALSYMDEMERARV